MCEHHNVSCVCLQLMRGAGCTINDLWDRDIDKQVERTRSRPLAAGTVTPLAALVFLGAQLSASLAILLQLNLYTQVSQCRAQVPGSSP
jgi:4-hydroxybenzoate polyprenyltransferase